MTRFRPSLAVLFPICWLPALAIPVQARAQFRASELGSVAQTVDGTRITVEFSRPHVRGRDSLFGRVVRWGEVWTPGANWATTLEVSREVKLNGHPVPKGKYSVWMVVRPAREWIVVLDPRFRRFHMNPPDSTPQQIRFAIRPEQRPPMEVLTWWFPANRPTGATLAMQWGTTYVTLDIEVTPTHPVLVSAEQAAPFLGSYELRFVAPADQLPRDTTIMWEPLRDEPVAFTVTHEGERLVARWKSPVSPRIFTIILVPLTTDWFLTGFLDQRGAVHDLEVEMVFEFARVNGKVTGFELRGLGDALLATGKRKS